MVEWTDKQILTALHFRDHEGMNCTEISEHFGKSRGAIIGLLHRVDKQTDKHDPDGNLNGTMKPEWWK